MSLLASLPESLPAIPLVTVKSLPSVKELALVKESALVSDLQSLPVRRQRLEKSTLSPDKQGVEQMISSIY